MEEKWFLLFRGGWLGAWISRRWVNKQKGEVKDMIFMSDCNSKDKFHVQASSSPNQHTHSSYKFSFDKNKNQKGTQSLFNLSSCPSTPFSTLVQFLLPHICMCASSFCSKVHNQPSRLGCSLALLYSNLEAMRHDGVLRSTSLE